MSLKTDAYYRIAADEALRRAGLTEPPIAMEALVGALGGRIVLAHMPAFFSAAAVDEDGRTVLVVNAALEECGRRRHLAHLLGHMLAAADDTQDGYPRDTRPDHHIADVIAAELILPAWIVAREATKWFNDHRYLARLFGVSEARDVVEDARARSREDARPRLGLLIRPKWISSEM